MRQVRWAERWAWEARRPGKHRFTSTPSQHTHNIHYAKASTGSLKEDEKRKEKIIFMYAMDICWCWITQKQTSPHSERKKRSMKEIFRSKNAKWVESSRASTLFISTQPSLLLIHPGFPFASSLRRSLSPPTTPRVSSRLLRFYAPLDAIIPTQSHCRTPSIVPV